MLPPENPFRPPRESEQLPRKTGLKWRHFFWLNISLVGALAVLELASLLWASYQFYKTEQQLGRRYVIYDQEEVIYFSPIGGLILLGLFFAIPNLVLFFLRFSRVKQIRQ